MRSLWFPTNVFWQTQKSRIGKQLQQFLSNKVAQWRKKQKEPFNELFEISKKKLHIAEKSILMGNSLVPYSFEDTVCTMKTPLGSLFIL